jgi:hypothetical protein
MHKKLLFTIAICFVYAFSHAQDGLFAVPEQETKKGLVIGFNANFDIPMADMAKRFGLGYRIGPSLFYKTKSNWVIGAKSDFLLGGSIREEGFLSNFHHESGGLIGSNGMRYGVRALERGYTVGLMVGKIIPFSERNKDNGLLLVTSSGFIQHKILIDDPGGNLNQLRGEYRKGYDRLTNGWFLEQYAGYNCFSRSGLVNFHIGFNVLAGFTQGRRNYWYDVRKPGNDSRFDLIVGVRAGWYIPIFRRKSEEFFFE